MNLTGVKQNLALGQTGTKYMMVSSQSSFNHPHKMQSGWVKTFRFYSTSLILYSAYSSNVSYATLLEGRQEFGRPGREVWAVIWDYLRPYLDQALAGEAVYRENDLVMFKSYGNGTLQEGYHHWRFVPIRDKAGTVIGLYNQSVDTTPQVLAERRLTTVRNLSEQMLVVRSLREYYDSIIEVLEDNPRDAPFALCYSVHTKSPGQTSGDVDIRLERSLGVPDDDPHARATTSVNIPPKVKSMFGPGTTGLSSPTLSAISALSSGSGSVRAHIYAEGNSWPIQRALTTRQCVIVQDCRELIKNYPIREWDELPVSAIVIPICSDSSTEIPESVMILGLNVRRPFDEDYDSWVHVIRSHLASSHTSVKAIEAEKFRIEEEVRMERAKTAWLRGAANDIRGPLALIAGPIDDVLESELNPKQKHALTTAKRNAARLLRLVDALTDLSRLEAGSVQGRFVPTDLGIFVTELSELFRPAIEKMGVTLEFDIEKTNKLVFVDPSLFEMLVSNLIGNAMKHTEQGTITVQVRYAEDTADVSVIDTGVGIPKDELENITAAFHRTSTAVHPGFQATGLGLSIVREIVHLHEGVLHVSSATLAEFDEQGSTFTAKIPLKERHGASADEEAPRFGKYGAALAGEAMRWHRGSRTGTSTGASSDTGNDSNIGSTSKNSDGMLFESDDLLLIVDSNSDLRDYVRGMFSPYCKVIEAVNGEEGRQLAIERSPNLILCDILLPKLSGMDLLSAIRENPKTAIIPVVMLSAVAGDEARLDALFLGAEDYLTKPFKPKELLARVHLHMQVGKKRKTLEEMYTQRQTELTLVSDYCPAGIMRSSSDGVLQYANEAWRKMAGMGPDEDPADWPKYVDAENRAHLYDVWPKFCNGDEKETRFNWKWLNGRSSAGVFVRLDKVLPGMTGILGCINDSTHEEMRIIEAERRRQEAEESKHQQELLVDLTSHEIRTPVSAILQCSSLVKENLSSLFEQLKLSQAVGFKPSRELLSDLAEDIEALESKFPCSDRH
jgi:signal transduction histidine kinase/DNA-binding NarL/FixJ family response regulator